MASVISLNGLDVQSVTLTVPGVGPWWADLDMVDDAPALAPGGKATLKIGDAAFVGTIPAGTNGTFGLRRRCRLVAGAAGWGKAIGPLDLQNDASIKARSVADGAAQACGERIGNFTPSADRLGAHYERREGPASAALELAAGGADWWVDYAGVTHVGARAAPPAGAYEVQDYNPRQRTVTLAVDDVQAVGVGSILTERLDAPVTVRALEITATAERLRVRVTVGDVRRSALADSLIAIIERVMSRRLSGSYRYRVVGMAGDRVNLQVVRKRIGLPDTARVSMWPGVAGAHATLTPGTEAIVTFLDEDPTQPAVIGFSGKDGASFVPVELAFCNGIAPVARVGDMVQSFFPPGATVITGLVGVPPAAVPFTGTLAVTGPIVGIIQTGNPKVKA